MANNTRFVNEDDDEPNPKRMSGGDDPFMKGYVALFLDPVNELSGRQMLSVGDLVLDIMFGRKFKSAHSIEIAVCAVDDSPSDKWMTGFFESFFSCFKEEINKYSIKLSGDKFKNVSVVGVSATKIRKRESLIPDVILHSDMVILPVTTSKTMMAHFGSDIDQAITYDKNNETPFIHYLCRNNTIPSYFVWPDGSIDKYKTEAYGE